MRRLLALSALLSLTLSGCIIQPRKGGWRDSAGTEQYERLMWHAIQDKHWHELENHLATTFVGVAANGQKFDRAGWVDYWKGSGVTDVSLGNLTVQPNGPDMVVTYDLHLAGQSPAAAPAGDLRAISVWQQLKDGWVLISHSETPVR
jgi:ketosteroid isomerase-like protein